MEVDKFFKSKCKGYIRINFQICRKFRCETSRPICYILLYYKIKLNKFLCIISQTLEAFFIESDCSRLIPSGNTRHFFYIRVIHFAFLTLDKISLTTLAKMCDENRWYSTPICLLFLMAKCRMGKACICSFCLI